MIRRALSTRSTKTFCKNGVKSGLVVWTHITIVPKGFKCRPSQLCLPRGKNWDKTNSCFAVSAIRCMLHRNPISSKLLQQQMFFLECNRFKLYMYNFSSRKVGVSLSSKCSTTRENILGLFKYITDLKVLSCN